MYYLPIYVNNRRMHVVKLSQTIEEVLPSFLVNSSNHYDVFSLPYERIQLICDEGNKENVDLVDAHYELDCVDGNDAPKYRHSENIPVYNIRICSGQGENKIHDGAKKYFRFSGNLGDTIAPGEEPFRLRALSHGEQQLKEYIIQFTYEIVDENETTSTYFGAIRICEYSNDDTLLKASLDFGSEASQIHLSTSRPEDNMNIRDAFVDIVGEDKDKDYWQGRKDDDKTLYKSIYHIHKKPAATNFGDMPMVNGDRNFLQSLLPVTAPTTNHILLPNLKLVEQLTGLLDLDNITFEESGFMGGPVKANLSSLKLSNGILRQILCNFLAVIMNSEQDKEYMHFILLVPNVYLQEKVNKLVTGLYDDFNLLCEKPLFSRYKGIEVSIVSESDASFFGVRARAVKDDLPFIKDANYLIIDAGKGTTDFSFISQRGNNLANYSSMYRSGIPASGHVLTYAFYDALRTYFHNIGCGDFFDDIMRKSVGKETSDILNFVSLLEQFKIRSKDLVEDNSMDNEAKALKSNYNNTLQALNTFLSNVLQRGKMIPGMTEALDEKIELMTSLLKDSIVGYTKNKLKKDVTCNKVFLTGRAFMLQQFRDAVTKMLVENGVVDTEAGVFYSNDLTKSICTYGAMKVGVQSVVNKNSNMLGCPLLSEETGDGKENVFNRFIRKIRKKRPVGYGEISFEFFYEGHKLNNVRNAVFSLSGMDTLVGTGEIDHLRVYYVGDGYIWKHGGVCRRVDVVGSISTVPTEVRERLVKESLFPFNIASFGLSYIPANPNSSDSGDTTYTPNDEPVVIDVPTPHDPNGNINALDR